MKVPPKRKGNSFRRPDRHTFCPLNESPSEKEGKSILHELTSIGEYSLNESPSEKEGKFGGQTGLELRSIAPSMKVPPKRKGNHGKTGGCRPADSTPQ